MLDKIQYKINTNLISQHSLRSPPSSNNATFDTGSIKHFFITNTPLINKNKTIIPLRVKLPNGTVLKSTHEDNIQLATLPKETTKASVFPHITYGALILVDQLCNHGCIATFAGIHFAIYNKQMEHHMKVPWDASTVLSTIELRKEARVILNNIQQLKFNRAPPITPVSTFQHSSNVGNYCNTKLKLAKFYHKDSFSPSISKFASINSVRFSTWPNFTVNITQHFPP